MDPINPKYRLSGKEKAPGFLLSLLCSDKIAWW
jgi:hypothetical protein